MFHLLFCVCVVSVIVKRPVLPPCVVDGRSRNPLYYYYYLSTWLKPREPKSEAKTKGMDFFHV